jgi:predicted TIM-barrel fold metal-dependent hydrolase
MRNPTFHLHFINEESTAIMSMVEYGVFETFPDLKIVVSHGGGAIPYQIGRFMSQWHGRDRKFHDAVRKLYYDTCLYTKNALELLFETMGTDRCVYGTEVPGAGTHPHPETGVQMDHLVPVIESIEFLSAEDKKMIFEDNARRLYNLPV